MARRKKPAGVLIPKPAGLSEAPITATMPLLQGLTGEQIRDRFRKALDRAGISQSELARRMTVRTGEKWLPNRISKILRAGSPELIFRVDDLAMMCQEAGISLVELVREPGRTLADLTASELKVLHLLREDPELTALIHALSMSRRGNPRAQRGLRGPRTREEL